jgi:hypothetical protein
MGQWDINSKALARSTGTGRWRRDGLENNIGNQRVHPSEISCVRLSFFTDAFLLSSKLWASMYHYRQYAVFKALG